MNTRTDTDQELDPTARAENERLSTWAKRCTAGYRDPFDGLTDCERAVIQSLKQAGYELFAGDTYKRIIRKVA